MEQWISFIIMTVLEFVILGVLRFVLKGIKESKKKLTLVDYKHEAWVRAYQKHSGNGLLESYEEILDDFIKKDNFIHDNK